MALDKVMHIRAELNKKSSLSPEEKTSDAIWVCCPFHGGGRERTPSCKINLTSPSAPVGYFYCFACGDNGGKGPWNKFASATGLAGFKASDIVNDVYSFSFQNEEESRPMLEYKKLPKFKNDKSWRTITPETLAMFDARRIDTFENYPIYIPVLVNKEYRGGIYCRDVMSAKLKKAGAISFINSKGRWTRKTLFGYNLAKKRKGPLWMVEGPRDTMKVAQLGGRVTGLMGAYFGEEKKRLVEQLDPPLIIAATDPDEAGRKALASIRRLITDIPIIHYEFPEGKDPANLTQRRFNRIMQSIRKQYRG